MALRRPCASQRATKPALVGLLNNAMSVSHILGVMSCKWPNFTAATAFEIQPRAIFFARSAEVGGWVSGFGVFAGRKWVGGSRVSGFNNSKLGGLGKKTQSSSRSNALLRKEDAALAWRNGRSRRRWRCSVPCQTRAGTERRGWGGGAKLRPCSPNSASAIRCTGMMMNCYSNTSNSCQLQSIGSLYA